MDIQHLDQGTKTAVDGALGVGGLVSPIWLGMIEHGFGVLMAVLGLALLVLRLLIAWREWKRGGDGPPSAA